MTLTKQEIETLNHLSELDKQVNEVSGPFALMCRRILVMDTHNKELIWKSRDALGFAETAMDHAIDLGYIGEGSTLGMFLEAMSLINKALIHISKSETL